MVVMSSIITSAAGAGARHRAVRSLVNTTMGRQPPPPQVEDVAEDGDDMRVPDLELSPAPSEASFESDAHDKLGSEMPKTPQTPASPAMSHSSVSLITPSAQPRHDMTGITPRFMDELRTMIKQEIAGHLKSMDPAPSPGITPSALMNSMFGTAYPSPPPSVVSTSQIPSPQSTSPRFTTAEVLPKRPTVRFRSRVPPIIHAQPRVCGTGETRATSAIQTAGVVSEGKTWGVLFDAEGYSTQRLGQALHSLACRVIDAFGIPGTDLITPDKMQNFYAKYRIENEEFPLQDAFKPCKNTTFERTQYLYQDLDCPYSLSQAVPQAHPTIPGLTRMGFVKWMTINILAYPDQESRRFALLLPDLAPLKIIGPDGAQECLPYTLPRNLLPATHDKKVRRLLDEALLDCLEDHDVSSPLPAARSCEMTPVIAHGSGPGQGRLWGRANSDASGVSTAQPSFVTLPPPPVGRHSTRAKSPVAADRCSASVPNMDRFADAMNLLRKGDTGIVSREIERNKDDRRDTGRERERERKSLVLSEPNGGNL